MPSFLDYQEAARKRTRVLVALYVLCLAGLVAAFCALVGGAAAMGSSDGLAAFSDPMFIEEIGPALAITALVVLGIVGIATLVKSLQLGGGGCAVAEGLGGVQVSAGTRDPLEKRLLNVVEEMAIASGIAIPAVYVLPGERGINAFAAGTSPNQAAVAVTRGALENLSRDELQCVVGHEFSHILNGDMRLNVRLLSSIFGIVCIAVFGRVIIRLGAEMLARAPRSRKKDDNTAGVALAAMAAGAAIWLLGSLGVLFGRILQSTISRQREFLADASAVQFTRNPVGMASALKTIGAVSRHSSLSSPKAGEVAHMLFAAGGMELLFASHPPLEKRIRRFDPGFDGDYRPVYANLSRRREALMSSAMEEANDDAVALHALLAAAYRPLKRAVREVSHAPAVICGALLDSDSSVRMTQMRALSTGAAAKAYPGLADEAGRWSAQMATLSLRDKVSTCELAVSSLRGEPEERRRALAEALHSVVSADGAVTPLEFAVEQRFRNRLLPPPPVPSVPARNLARPAAAVLRALAAFGANSDEAAEAAFAAGAAALAATFGDIPGSGGGNGATKSDAGKKDGAPDFAQFSEALDALRALSPADKQTFLAACSAVVRADGTLTDDEAVSMAAVADTIGAAGWTA